MEYGLLGGKLGHSYSPLIHSYLGDYGYELYACGEEELERILLQRNFRGMNVTIPYKRAAYERCDVLSEEAQLLGNVNTLLVDEAGRLHGNNTDWHGFLSLVEMSGIDVRGKKAAVLGGSGGSGRTAAAALAHLGALEVVSVSRAGSVTYPVFAAEHADTQIIVNATPVGMFPKNGVAPVELANFPACEGVLDLIYNPYRTALLLDAEERGIPCACGLWMLVAQAHRAAELFTGRGIPGERIGMIYGELRAHMENIVLVGMPGSGKTSVGRALAERMDRRFVDLDEEFVRRAGMSIPDYFQAHGVDSFREEESKLAAEFGKEGSLVIATGGGVVLRHDNMRALRQNGEVFYVQRPLDALDRQGRPLSTDQQALTAMYEERLPLYLANSAMTIDNSGTVEQAANAIEEGFYALTHHQRP